MTGAAAMSRIRRSFLFVPADRPDRMAKAAVSPADVVVLELEDGVAPENKSKAREEAGRALAELDFGQREKALRINRISTAHGLADLLAILDWPQKPDILMLPKVESGGEVGIYDELLTTMAIDVELMLLIESGRGVLNARAIANGAARNTSMCLGLADLCAELGSEMDWETMAGHRNALVVACGAGRVAPVDSPYLDIRNPEGLEDECRRAKKMGFTGKLCIHPAQVEPVNQAFTPGPEAVARARRIVRAVAQQGQGAIVVDGRMVDGPVVRASRQIVDMADRLGL